LKTPPIDALRNRQSITLKISTAIFQIPLDALDQRIINLGDKIPNSIPPLLGFASEFNVTKMSLSHFLKFI